ncbi:MAG TPA: WD40 repeat domain-containing protein [Pirellulales bacterium]|nr:WD40 repeat domain-containing protein [Pirellulales bacterium]
MPVNEPQELLKRYQPKLARSINLDRQMTSLRYSPCGKLLAAGGFDGTVRRFDATSDDMVALSSLEGHSGWVTAIAFHPDAQRLFSVDSWGRFSAWPFTETSPAPLYTVPQAHQGWIRGLAVSADGTAIATCGSDQRIRVWSPDDGSLRQELTAGDDVYALAFHPQGALVSGDLHGAIKEWDVAAGKVVREFDARSMYLYDRIQDVGGVRVLAFSRCGTLLVAGGSSPKGGGFVQGAPLIHCYDWTTGVNQHALRPGADNDGFVFDLHELDAGIWMMVSSGQPGSGKLLFHEMGAEQPFFAAANMANCHALAAHPSGSRLAILATNGGSNGNGRRLTGDQEYAGNFSPIHLWDLARPKDS